MLRSVGDDQRGQFHIKPQFARPKLKQMCVSVGRVKLWCFLVNDFKCCSTVIQFKNMYRDQIIGRYDVI